MQTESEPIEDFVLASEHNLRIAATVYEAWPKARQRIVDSFLQRLGSRLRRELKDWKFEPWNAFFDDRYAGYDCWKPTWKHHSICLGCQDHGARMVLGVRREKDSIGNRPFCEELSNELRKIDPAVSTNAWWEGWITMRLPACDWRTPEVLWRMHTAPAFLDDVAGQLLEVVRVSKKILDRLAREK